MKKFLGIVILIAVIVFAGWAYMNSGVPTNPKPENSASPTQTPTLAPSEMDTPELKPEETATPTPTPEAKKLSVKAVYVGLADSNSIEIKINDKYVNAKLSEQLKKKFDNIDIEEEDNVIVEYTLEKGVYVVHNISKN